MWMLREGMRDASMSSTDVFGMSLWLGLSQIVRVLAGELACASSLSWLAQLQLFNTHMNFG
jgi:hypothetical protein